MMEIEKKQTFEVRDLRQKSKFVVDDKFLNGYAKFVGIYAVGVYVALCRHANKGQSAWPSIGKIAEELNISMPMVYRAIRALETFNIIKKQRIGKRANNRYWLLDKKEWVFLTPEAVDKFLGDINKVNISDVNSVNITSKQRLHHPLTVFTSNSKETHSKETHSKEQKEYQAEPDASIKSSVDNLLNPEPGEEELRQLEEIANKISPSFSIYTFMQRIKKETKHFPPPQVMIKVCQQYLKDKEKINNPWAWFAAVVKRESETYYAQLQINANKQYKKEPVELGKLFNQIITQHSEKALISGGE